MGPDAQIYLRSPQGVANCGEQITVTIANYFEFYEAGEYGEYYREKCFSKDILYMYIYGLHVYSL